MIIAVIVCALLTGTLIVVFIQLQVVERRNFASVSGLVLLTLMVGCVMRSAYIYSSTSDVIEGYLLLGKEREVLLYGALAVATGVLCWSLGYIAASKRRIASGGLAILSDNFKDRPIFIPLVLLSLLGVGVFFAYVDAVGINLFDVSDLSKKRRMEVEGGNYEYASLGYHLTGMLLIPVCFLMALMKSMDGGGRRYKVLSFILFCVWLYINVVTSSRFDLISVLIVGLLIFQMKYGRIRVSRLVRVGMLAVMLFLILGGMRKAIPEDQLNRKFIIDHVYSFSDSFLGNRNWLDITKTAHIVDSFPEKGPYLYGTSLVSWVMAPVPRTVWNDKPLIRYGPLLGEKVFGRSTNKTGVPPGVIGEMYWNFGWLGLFLPMFVVGAITRIIINTLQYKADGQYLISILLGYTTIALSLTLFAGELAGAVLLVGKILLALGFVKITMESFRAIGLGKI